MLYLKNPKDHYVSAILDENGNAVKVVCDLLIAGHYVIDTKTNPMTTLTVTFDRADEIEPPPPEATQLPTPPPAPEHLPVLPEPPQSTLLRAGPMTQHMITGNELVMILEAPGGITVEAIEESVLRTGIPNAYIAAEDLELYEAGWRVAELIAGIRRQVTELEAPVPAPVMLGGVNVEATE
jgi:hypothetical protein